jgi:hypothetical protein
MVMSATITSLNAHSRLFLPIYCCCSSVRRSIRCLCKTPTTRFKSIKQAAEVISHRINHFTLNLTASYNCDFKFKHYSSTGRQALSLLSSRLHPVPKPQLQLIETKSVVDYMSRSDLTTTIVEDIAAAIKLICNEFNCS